MSTGILCDYEIETAVNVGNVVIRPYSPDNVQPNSYDIHLGKEIVVMYPGDSPEKKKLPYTLKHGEFILGTTAEYIEIKKSCCAELSGKSTCARYGISVHQTGGWIDCGFKGNITLEIVNNGHDYELVSGMPIGQLIFHTCQNPRYAYGERGNHYQGQEGVTLPWDYTTEDKPLKKSKK
mgnify:CR=1 FL=1